MSNCQHTNRDADGFCTECGVLVSGGNLVTPTSDDHGDSVSPKITPPNTKSCPHCQFTCGSSDAVCESCGHGFELTSGVNVAVSSVPTYDNLPAGSGSPDSETQPHSEPVATVVDTSTGNATLDDGLVGNSGADQLVAIAAGSPTISHQIEIHIDPDQYLIAAGDEQRQAVPCPVGIPVRIITLAAGEMIVGRLKAENDSTRISVQDPFVSKEHFKLVIDEAGLHVVPLKSTNETILNGHKIDDRNALKAGDIIQVGGWTRLVIR